MLDDKEGLTDKEKIKLLAIIIIMLAIFLYSVFSKNGDMKLFKKEINKIDVASLFEPIKDNYELIINKTIDNNLEKINYINDGNFKLYNLNDEENGYLIYEGKIYNVELNNFKIKEVKKEFDFINDNYANIDFIKSVLVYCDFVKSGNKKVICNMELSDFINGYNNYYYSKYVYDGSDLITFEFQYETVINSIKVDYSKANKIIKNNDSNVEYEINIKKVNSNDYSYLFDIFKDTLKK